MASQQPLPAKISKHEFDDLLAQYQPLVESVSAGKPAKDGQKTLVELDRYRYVEAPKCFRIDAPKRVMEHDDVKALVEWKLRHGKFRPSLMKLVLSNDSETVNGVIEDALKAYRDDTSDPSAAIAILSSLKGIGPATASLLLSVHDPDRVLFFSDEAFYWLCCGGKKDPIKYNKKEYAALGESAQQLMKRLGVRALDLEKVAYVAIRQAPAAGDSGQKSEETGRPEVRRARGGSSKKPSAAKEETPAKEEIPEKRKRSADEDTKVAAVPSRRSKRSRPELI
ncbi:uncharacterized protein DNG_05010 [Cephalotrichum gorgonifer]|uniref:Uncharacterized protein n=1 Tax=Cephalotrichum gorgonifer TaxID=2041049 RepID=A0AAE8N041_9PEZI|nr:uncharacterized protein DNG_05010 [Cephalotrichum gorgonifer]